MAAMERQKLREGIRLAMAVSADGNKFIQDTKPWVGAWGPPGGPVRHCLWAVCGVTAGAWLVQDTKPWVGALLLLAS